MTGSVHRRARSAVARSAAEDRSLAVLLGLVLFTGGTLVALLAYDVFGHGRAARPLLDPVIVDTLRAQPVLARVVAVLAGLLLVVLGITCAARSLRPEPRPDLVVDAGPETIIVVSTTAASEAVAAQAAALPGVARARARMVGRDRAPALRITLWLTDDIDVADIDEVLRRVDEDVVAGARAALELGPLPVAVRLELAGTSKTARPRVV